MVKDGAYGLLLALSVLTFVVHDAQAQAKHDDFEGEEAFFALEEEIITATRAPQPLLEAPAVISVISRAEIERHGWRSVGEALTSVPGLYGYHDGVTWAYGVRGVAGGLRANSRVLKVLLNGRPVAYRYDTTNWLGRELIPMTAVERIEVIRGPASALYGADAFLGVINVITVDPSRAQYAVVEGEGAIGSDGRYTGGGQVSAGVRAGVFDALASAAWSQTDRSGRVVPTSSPRADPVNDATESEDDLARPLSALLRLGVQLGDDHRLELDGHLQLLDAHQEFADYGVLTHANRVSVMNGFVRLGYGGAFAVDHRIAANVAWASGAPTDAERIDTGSTLNAFVRDEGYHALDADLQYQWAAAKWLTMTLGVDTSMVVYDLTTVDKMLKTDLVGPVGSTVPLSVREAGEDEKTFVNLGVYVQAVVKPLPWLLLTAGGRYDEHTLYDSQFNGRAGLVLKPLKELTLKVLAGSSFKAPSPLHLYAPTPKIDSGDIVGNPALGTEDAHAYEVALIAQPLEGLSLSVAGYLSKVRDKVEFVQLGSDRAAQNVTDVDSLGLEADIRYHWRGLTAYAFVAYDSSERTPAQSESPLFGTEVFEYPQLMGGGGLAYRIDPAYLRLSLSVTWASERRASQSNIVEAAESYALPGYALLDVAVTSAGLKLWGQRETRIGLRISDVGNEAPTQPGYGGVDFPQRGRWFQFTVSQQF